MNPGVATSRPVTKQFMRWEGGAAAATPVIDWVLSHGGTARYHEADEQLPELIHINTLEGTMQASVGDVVIRGVHGEFYPCKPDIFAQTYEVDKEPSE